MAKFYLQFTLCFCFLIILTDGSLIDHEQDLFSWSELRQQQNHRLRAKTSCGINRIVAAEPTIEYRFEAGVSEFWDQFSEQFNCAGVVAVRNVIQPNGLLLPHYNDAPQLIYVVQGAGVEGTVFPGCGDEYESEIGDEPGFVDWHQKLRSFGAGDVLALPAGITHWFYNNGDVPVVTLSLLDTRSEVNQLDQKFRVFFLAGNYPILRGGGGGDSREQSPPKEGGFGNIFTGFDEQILAGSFNVSVDLATNLKGSFDHRGRIVRAERLEIQVPQAEEEAVKEQNLVGQSSLCSMKLRINLNKADPETYNPLAGWITSLNSQKLSYLNQIQLSAERGVLYKNAIMGPRWNVNAHMIMYVTEGSSRIQVVGDTGKLLFDGEVRDGQLIIVPQGFMIMQKAGEQGCQWIAFKTNADAKISSLAGRLSTITAMPEEVLMYSYDISREDAKQLKYNREESTLLSSPCSDSHI